MLGPDDQTPSSAKRSTAEDALYVPVIPPGTRTSPAGSTAELKNPRAVASEVVDVKVNVEGFRSSVVDLYPAAFRPPVTIRLPDGRNAAAWFARPVWSAIAMVGPQVLVRVDQ